MVPSATSVLFGKCNTRPGCIFLFMVMVVKADWDEAGTIPAKRNKMNKRNLIIANFFLSEENRLGNRIF